MSDGQRDPLADKTGVLRDLLAELDEADLGDYEAYWQAQGSALSGSGDGYGSWWSSKHVAAARTERRRRMAAPESAD